MKKLTAIIGGIVLSGNAMAYDVEGLDLPLNTSLLFQSNFVQALVTDVDLDGGAVPALTDYELQGYGNITFESGDSYNPLSSLCVTSGCSLTYTFSGLGLQSANVNGDGTAIDLAFDASNAQFDFWLHDDATDYSVSAGDILNFNTDWATTYAMWDASMDMYSSNGGTATQYLDTTSLNSVFEAEQKLTFASSLSQGPLEISDQTIGAGWYFDKEGSDENDFGTIDIFVLSSILPTSISDIDIFTGGPALSAFGAHQFVTSVPEPSTLAMFSLALLGFGAAARRKNKA